MIMKYIIGIDSEHLSLHAGYVYIMCQQYIKSIDDTLFVSTKIECKYSILNEFITFFEKAADSVQLKSRFCIRNLCSLI